MGCPVLGFFQLVLGVPPKLTPDTVNEGLETPEILLKEGYKLWPRDGSDAFVAALVAALVLSPFKADGTTEKGGGKKSTIHPCGAKSFEIILTLLV